MESIEHRPDAQSTHEMESIEHRPGAQSTDEMVGQVKR